MVGGCFAGRALWVRYRRLVLRERGIGLFTMDDSDMPIDAYIGWMNVFAVPFAVVGAYFIYRHLQQNRSDF